MELTNANDGSKIGLIFNPLMFCRLITPGYLHDDYGNYTINKTTMIMIKFNLN
jgi:hypothetical protein